MSGLETTQGQARPLIFGEVLFDVFPDGARVLGGAPFNVAWHLTGFGLRPLFISRIGRDAPGEQVLSDMRDWGMDTRGVQIDAGHPTGTVRVSLQHGQPEFAILPDQAYDFIDAAACAALAAESCTLLYHGTLAARSPVSRRALQSLRAGGLPIFVDINLRPPWWDRDGVGAALRGARWAKLNDSELAVLLDHDAAAEELRARYGLEWVVVTRGERGACLAGAQGLIEARLADVDGIVDTVGAGDAFSAVLIVGLHRGWPWSETLPRAVEFAAAVCRIRGAVSRDRDLYRMYLQRWKP